jgi:hypothetical protein
VNAQRVEKWTARLGALLVALGIFEHIQVVKDVGLGLIVVSVAADLATKGKYYLRFVANVGYRLRHGK